MLENASKNLAKSISIKINVEELDAALIDKLEALCKQHKGQEQLKITLLDYTTRPT